MSGPALTNRGAHCDPFTLRSKDACGEGFNVPSTGLVVPLVNDRLEAVSSGPNATPVMEPAETGSYCSKKPLLAVE